MSNNAIDKPLSIKALVAILSVLIAVVGIIGFSWWKQVGAPIDHGCTADLLEGIHKIYFIYDVKDTMLPMHSLRTKVDTEETDMVLSGVYDNSALGQSARPLPKAKKEKLIQDSESTALNRIVSFRNYGSAVILAKDYVGQGAEETQDPKMLSDIDSQIRQAIARTIEKNGYAAEETAFGDNHVSLWGDRPLKPVRIIVTVKKRFEQGKCLFAVQASLQHEGTLAIPTQPHVYATVKQTAPLFQEVPRSEAQQAIDEEVTSNVQYVLKKGQERYSTYNWKLLDNSK